MKQQRTWILIADGRRARVLESLGRNKPLAEVPGTVFETELPASRDIWADKPGRGFESVGQARHANEPTTDPHRELKRRFAERLSGMLEEALSAKRFDRLVIVAPPVTMGDLRAELSKAVSAAVAGELTADLTKVPLDELPSRLEPVLPA